MTWMVFKKYYVVLLSLIMGCRNAAFTGPDKQVVQVTDTIVDSTTYVHLPKLDIKAYNRHTKNDDNEWITKNKQGDVVCIRFVGNEYWKDSTPNKSLFTYRKSYYLDGSLKLEGQYFLGNGFGKGIWSYYDSLGKRIKTIDRDAPYAFSWEQVLHYMIANNINPYDNYTSVQREESNGPPYWIIMYKTNEENKNGYGFLKEIILDGKTGYVKSERRIPIGYE